MKEKVLLGESLALAKNKNFSWINYQAICLLENMGYSSPSEELISSAEQLIIVSRQERPGDEQDLNLITLHGLS